MIDFVRAKETSEGVLVTIAENKLGTYVTRRSDLRLQLIIPRAGASAKLGYVYSSTNAIVKVERDGPDAVITFSLSPGTNVSVTQYADKLEALITSKRQDGKVIASTGNGGNRDVSDNSAVSEPVTALPKAISEAKTPQVEVLRTPQVIETPNPPSLQRKSVAASQNAIQTSLAKKSVLSGHVLDTNNSTILGASISLSTEGGIKSTVVTNAQGEFSFAGLDPGVYSIIAAADGFQSSEIQHVRVGADQRQRLEIKLEIGIAKAEVTVSEESLFRRSLTTRVIKGKDLDRLPKTPGGLAATLRALALRSGGARGPQILVDGFASNKLPPKESIREIRINENPFSAEYAQIGLARIEILTKPGTNKYHTSAFFNFNDESLNTKNSFASDRTPYQYRLFGGDVSGPLGSRRGSFFLDFQRESISDNALVNATVVDSAFNIVPLKLSLVIPQERTSISPRIDYQLGANHTLVGRYLFSNKQSRDKSVGGFSLPERAVISNNVDHELQLTETSILSPTMVNETRFRFVSRQVRESGNDARPVISVPGSFIGGGSDFALSIRNERFAELQNYTTWNRGKHDLKFGGQLRWGRLEEYAPENFNGTFTFAGGTAPRIDSLGKVILDPVTGKPEMISISGIERYRRTVMLKGFGLSAEEVRALGGGATQFSIVTGKPEAEVVQKEVGGFIQDDWQVRPNFTVSSGLRIEAQNNIEGRVDLAPRLSFVWAPGSADSKTVIRGGGGIFYDRFGENYIIEARRFNGLNQHQYIVSQASILDLFPISPDSASLALFAIPQSIRQIATGFRAPLSAQLSFSLERQLPNNFSVAATYTNTRAFRAVRSRNINAPLVMGDKASRPIPGAGEIFEYQSNGRFYQSQLILNTAYTGKKLSFYSTYLLGYAKSDTEGAGSFPAYQYDLAGEWGRSGQDVRHQLYIGGWVSAPWGITLNPLLFFRTGAPFNIISGRDTNGDGLFTERPAFATDLTRPTVVLTPFGAFDLEPLPGQAMIPRNFGNGQSFFSINLGLSKTLTFFNSEHAPKFSNAKPRRPLSVTFSAQIENLLNRTNAGIPIGDLSSESFGRALWSAGPYGFGSNPGGNRRIEIHIYLKY